MTASLLMSSSVSFACEPTLGKVCAEQLPDTYALDCEDGCYLVTPSRMTEYVMSARLVPKLREDLVNLRVLMADVIGQRDAADERGDLAIEELTIRRFDLAEAQKKLAAAPGWTSVVLGVLAGVGIGIIVGAVL